MLHSITVDVTLESIARIKTQFASLQCVELNNDNGNSTIKLIGDYNTLCEFIKWYDADNEFNITIK